jgi:hypothetical protein
MLSSSITHYERILKPHSGVQGIFFKFDMKPIYLTLIQRITTLEVQCPDMDVAQH